MKKQIITFILNNSLVNAEVNPSLPLLDFIRKEKHLTSTKEVCKEGDCGACTVLLGKIENGEVRYKTITSCIYPIGNCNGKHIVTLEGINQKELLLPQKVFIEENASQCGFCTPGFLMSLTAYLLNNNEYSLEEAKNAVAGNICRCTGYHSILRAIDLIIKGLKREDNINSTQFLIRKKIIPEYFTGIRNQLFEISNSKIKEKDISNIFVGGGSDLFVQRPDELLESEAVFLDQKNLNFITEQDGKIEIGGGTTFEEIKQSHSLNKLIPTLKKDIDLIASLPVRNSATIGGNLSNASPIGDLTIILLALNSTLILSNGKSERELLLSEYYLDYKKLNKAPEEYINSVIFEKPKSELKFSFEKVSKRTYLDIASVNSAMMIATNGRMINRVYISAGGVAAVPKILKETNDYLTGKEITIENIENALIKTQNEISPIDDVRGSAVYKRMLLNQLVKAHFLKLFPEEIKETELI